MDAERSRRRDGTSATRVKADDRYGGARPFKALYVYMSVFSSHLAGDFRHKPHGILTVFYAGPAVTFSAAKVVWLGEEPLITPSKVQCPNQYTNIP